MNIANLYRKLKQILDDSNISLTNKGLNKVNSLCDIFIEVKKLDNSMNKLPYFLAPMEKNITENDLLSVTSIGDYAFYDCNSLTSITIPSSVTSIGEEAFCGCYHLTSITIPDSVTSIGGYAFHNTAYYKNELNWINNILYIGNYLIEAKTTISGVYKIKEGAKCIADNAFYGCSSLNSITIPDSVTSIGNFVFYHCSSLESMTIPDSVTSIGNFAFGGCYSLTSVTIGNGVASIGDRAFSYCRSLESVAIPDSVTSIGEGAFCGCDTLASVTIGNGVASIGSEAFASHGLTNIYINATTPPILGGANVMFSTTTIHVPIGSGDAYKSATNWSYFANKIVEDIEVK